MSKVQKLDIPGGEYVLLPAEEYERLLAAAERRDQEAAELRAIEAARADPGERWPLAVVDRLVAGGNPVKVYREYRGLTGVELAERAGLTQAAVSAIETGKRRGKVDTLKRIADALGVDLDDLT